MKYFIGFLILMGSSLAVANTYIFVSYSMNDEALKAYFEEAKAHGAILVMRGLLNNSFIETKHKIDKLEIAYDVNPELFEKYAINEVPAIVHETTANIHKIVGHISLKAALEKFNRE